MHDLAKTILDQIKDRGEPDFQFADDFIFPRYEGLSILNIPTSAGALLGVNGFKHPGLIPELHSSIPGKTKNIILILLDALAFFRFQKWLEEEPGLVWHSLLKEGILAPLTSITPSTTCAAITSYWTGASAAEHGIMGYEMWLKEYGVAANMIEHKPVSYQSGVGNLSLAGFDPDTFLPVDSIAELFFAEGVEVHAFQHYAIINSGLSQTFMNGANRHPIRTASDMWISIRELLESQTENRKYIWAYWDHLDSISHIHGPDSERAKAEFTSFSSVFEDTFLKQLDPGIRKDTLVLLTADHGQIATDRKDHNYDLKNHPDFTKMLHIKPTGENRLAYLHIKPGKVDQVKKYIQSTWPDQFILIDPVDAVKAGLFGQGDHHPGIYDRLGDLIVAARGTAFWWWASKPNPLIGRHGGLSPEEMLIPFLAARL